MHPGDYKPLPPPIFLHWENVTDGCAEVWGSSWIVSRAGWGHSESVLCLYFWSQSFKVLVHPLMFVFFVLLADPSWMYMQNIRLRYNNALFCIVQNSPVGSAIQTLGIDAATSNRTSNIQWTSLNLKLVGFRGRQGSKYGNQLEQANKIRKGRGKIITGKKKPTQRQSSRWAKWRSWKGGLEADPPWVTWQTCTREGEHADLKYKWGGRLTRNRWN